MFSGCSLISYIIITAYHNLIPRSDWQMQFHKIIQKAGIKSRQIFHLRDTSADKKINQNSSKYEKFCNKIEELLIMSWQM